MADLIDYLIKEGFLKTKAIIEAFRIVRRKDFLPAQSQKVIGAGGPEELKDLAELDSPLSIGYGQTISQPLVVAFMLELLQPKLGEKILDIGSGSGWTSALMAQIVGEKGRVVAVEIIPELMEFGRKNISRYNFIKKGIVKIVCGDGSIGFAGEAPFDKILASASAKDLPLAWKRQLKVGGRIVASIKDSIWVFEKKPDGRFKEKEYPGFVFVPLVS